MGEGDPKAGLSRRSAMRLIAAAVPAAMVAGRAAGAAGREGAQESPAAPAEPKLSKAGEFVVDAEPGLSDAERLRLGKQLPGFEEALRKLRDFEIPDNVEPAVRFSALRSGGSRR